MIRFLVTVVFLAGLSGCSTTIENLRGPGCPGYDVHGIEFKFCDEKITPYKSFAMEADFILHRMEFILSEINLPGFIDLAAEKHTEVTVGWYDPEDPPMIGNTPYVGLYYGHWDPENIRIGLHLKDDRQFVSTTALAHEFWHFYEHQVFDFDMVDISESPEHFVLQELGDHVIMYANDFEPADIPGMADPDGMKLHGQDF